MKHGGQRCPTCTGSESAGEYAVREYLESNNYNFIPQYRFADCRNIYALPFDFFLPDLNITIEFDGAQHYIPVKRGNQTDVEAELCLREIQKRDNIKTQYCKDNHITLIRIPYWELKHVNKILEKELNKY